MKLVENRGIDRIADLLQVFLDRGARLDLVTPQLSLFAFHALQDRLRRIDGCRIALPSIEEWIAPGEGLADLRVRYASLLRDVFGALFESEPDRPLGRLLTAVTCADR